MKRSLGPKTLLYPTPVMIVCTYDRDGKANAMAAAWGGICSSKPAAVAVSLREATYSHGCIAHRGAFTINIPSEDHVREADYFGIASGKDEDKFARTGLTPVRAEHVDAPLIEEFPVALECKLAHTFELGLHTQFVGEVVDVKVDEELFDGRFPDMEKIRPLVFEPGRHRYYGLGDFVAHAFKAGRDLKRRV